MGSYLVYIFFLLLFVWWGRRIALSGFSLLGKILSILAIVIAFLIVEAEAANIWPFLRFDIAVVTGFLWGIFLPYGRPHFQLPQRQKKTNKPQQQIAHAEIDRQKRAAEDDLRRQEREASERLKQEHQTAKENLRRETERVKREADRVRQVEARAREQANKQRQQTKDPINTVNGV